MMTPVEVTTFRFELENTTDELSKRTPSWNMGKANWDGFKTSCLGRLTPEANKNNEENILCKKAVRLRKATF